MHGVCAQTFPQPLSLAVTVVEVDHNVAVTSRPRAFQSVDDQTMSCTRLLRLQFNAKKFDYYSLGDSNKEIKLAAYGTDGRLLLTANFKVT